MNEEYIYDIGKYTIGVDTNGEDGIGLTVAIINDDGEIHLLGNCYGDNARCIDLLIKENQELKKQLENCYCNRTDCSARIKDSKKYDSLVQRIENQQKEFIEWLESEIKECKDAEEKYADGDDNSYYNNNELRIEILSKYKEIIGGK